MAEFSMRRSGFRPGEIHPGAAVALRRFRMTETDVAKAVRDGELSSPQQYENVWFFRVRLTGTGTSYRPKHHEEVYRTPEIFLSDEFVERFLGLPVVLEHPKREVLDSKEFAERVIGTVTQAWVENDEVWGIARIYDQSAASYMADHQVSTSPAVVFRYAEETEKVPLPGGEHLLIEGKPSLLDHLAICEEGVWDKGGPPSGVDIAARSDSMAEENEDKREAAEAAEDRKRDDTARRDEKIDKLLTGIDGLTKRMDALEERQADRHDGKRDDGEAEAEQEREQAETLHQIAKEEEAEAEKEEGAADKRRDARKRDDRARDDEDDEPLSEAMARHNGESDDSYSDRMDTMSRRRDDARRYGRRDDESPEEHADRCDAAHRRMDARRDRARDDRKRDDRARDDRKRDDGYDDRRDRKRDDAGNDEESEEAEHQMAKADAVRVSGLESRIDRLERRTTDRTDDEETKFADAQARADDAYGAFGRRAPRPLAGENLMGYRIRLARGLQEHSSTWKDSDLARLARADAPSFVNAEAGIYADATSAGLSPRSVPLGQLREIHKRRPGGGEIIEFAGDPLSWMSSFMPVPGALRRFGLRQQQ